MNSDFDRFLTPYHLTNFPDIQDRKLTKHSTCAGCDEPIYIHEIYNREILDVWGMAIHDDYQCIKKATNAVIYELEDQE